MPLDYLNDAQRQAVEYRGGHLLIVAGPGTGKTQTLTERIAQLIPELQPHQKALAITFTNKAAKAMRARLRAQVARTESSATVGTFHGFCWQMLQRFSREAQLPAGCRVALPEEISELVKELWANESAAARSTFLEEISKFKSGLASENILSFVRHYNEFLRERQLLDFDDLLAETVRLLTVSEPVRSRLRNEYPYICVDEYQDINAVQHELLKLLAGGGAGGSTGPAPRVFLTAIGDPNQAIYGFRGSDVKFFESFPEDFPGAAVLTLSDNYRSAAHLLAASAQVIGRNERFVIPPLTARLYLEGQLAVHEAPTDKAEAEYVVHQIEKLVGGTSYFSLDTKRVASDEDGRMSFKDFAVLYRLNAQRFVLEEALQRSGIPYYTSAELSKVEEWNSSGMETSSEEGGQAEKVSLLTLHAAKGLEFKVVFMVGCEEHLLPLDIARMVSDPKEERRLFYVGMTRARERLYLLRARKRQLFGQFLESGSSQYLADIEEQLKAYDIPEVKKRKPKSREAQLGLFEEA